MSPTSPMNLPQDNPFPTFPSQKGNQRPKAGSIDEAMSLNAKRSMTMPQNMPGSGSQRGYDAQQQRAEPGPAAGFHGPMSPTYIPPRPATAGGTKPSGYGQQQFEQRPPMPQAHPAQQH